jgi:hypothetical protein
VDSLKTVYQFMGAYILMGHCLVLFTKGLCTMAHDLWAHGSCAHSPMAICSHEGLMPSSMVIGPH